MARVIAPKADITVEINGVLALGVLQAAITSTNCFSADAYSLTFAMGNPPLSDLATWSALSSGRVEVFAVSGPGPGLTSLITGVIDCLHVDALRGTVAIEGRDLSSSLVDSYQQGDFVNQTASEIVAAIANRNGLGAVVTPTSGMIGRYYGDGYTRLSTGQFSRLKSDWDVVVELARENEFDIFVRGRQLFFQPAAAAPTTIVPLTPNLVQNLRFNRSLGIGGGIGARVQSWNSQDMASLDSAKSTGVDASAQTSAANPGQPYLFSVSNFTSTQVAQSAARFTAELNRLRTTMIIEMPWDLRIAPRAGIMLSQTASLFDGLYIVDTVERHFNSACGSRQIVRAVSAPGFSAL